MDTTPFEVELVQEGLLQSVTIRPCCNEDNVVDYAVWMNNELAFTITKDKAQQHWVIALKNADDIIEDSMVQSIGIAIDKKLAIK